MRRLLKMVALFGVGYAWGRSEAQARIDRADPAQLRSIANEVEQHQQHWNRGYPRRPTSFERRPGALRIGDHVTVPVSGAWVPAKVVNPMTSLGCVRVELDAPIDLGHAIQIRSVVRALADVRLA